jgi:hypothetical protein
MSIKGLEQDPMVQFVAVQIHIEYERAKVRGIQKPLTYALHRVHELWDAVEVSETEETK